MAGNSEIAIVAGQEIEITINGTTPEESSEKETIFRVISFFREAHQDLFEPRWVSIGPYHWHNRSLRLEEHKRSFRQSFLNRRIDIPLDNYISAVREVARTARECYRDINISGDEEFVEILFLDGCFILEHLLRLSNEEEETRASAYYSTDLRAINAQRTDLALLENQIPFFVLHELYKTYERDQMDCTENGCPLRELFFEHSICSSFINYNNDTVPRVSCRHIDHYLHLIYTCMTTSNRRMQELMNSREEPEEDGTPTQWCLRGLFSKKNEDGKTTGIPCASKLNEAGVIFKCKQNPTDMFNITFENGTMEIPYLSIGSDKKIIISNIVEFEQKKVFDNVPPTVMNYLSLMDALVNTKEDVNLLVKKGILHNMMSNEETAAAFFNDLGEFFVPEKYKTHRFSTEIQKYCASQWRTYRTHLVNDYLSSPWAIISVLVAAVLFILTIVQTVFTGIQTFKN